MKTKEFYFKELLNYLTIKEDKVKYPGYIFYFKDKECYFRYNIKNGYFYVKYIKVWKVFETKYLMKYGEVEEFIKNQVEDHFKLKDVTPRNLLLISNYMVEDHFKLKDVTPLFLFNCGIL